MSGLWGEYCQGEYCETHRRALDECLDGDASCRVCGCGGLCDSGHPCPLLRPPGYWNGEGWRWGRGRLTSPRRRV